MTSSVPKISGIKIPALFSEINRLRVRDGHETMGGLSLALKVVAHFREENNPRVAEAFKNLDSLSD